MSGSHVAAAAEAGSGRGWRHRALQQRASRRRCRALTKPPTGEKPGTQEVHCEGLAGLQVVQKRASSNTGEKQDWAVCRQLPLVRLKKGAQLVHWVGLVTLQLVQPGLAFWHARLAWHCKMEGGGAWHASRACGRAGQAAQLHAAHVPHPPCPAPPAQHKRTVLVVALRNVPPAQRVHSVGLALSHSVQLVMAVLQKSFE